MKLIHIEASNNNSLNLDGNMVPAINIVFLLSIFFMVAGQIKSPSKSLELPNSQNDQKVDAKTLVLEIHANGEYLLEGEQVNDELSKVFSDQTITELSIRIHRQLPASALDPVLKLARTYGMESLSIQTIQP